MTTRKKTGRPLKEHPPGEMVQIGVQITSEMKAQLQRRAEAANRSLSQEVVLALRGELESPAATCMRMFGGEAGFAAAWLGQNGMFLALTEGTTTTITVRKADLDRVKALLKRIEAKAIVTTDKGDDQ